MFSKSFGYALRGILYIATMQDERRKIRVDEIASKLAVPRHFMGKILKNLVKHGVLQSTKGPYGGFFVNDVTLSTSILQIVLLTDGDGMFKNCMLRLHECSTQNPCPLHHKVVKMRDEFKAELTSSIIGDLLRNNKTDFINSLITLPHVHTNN
jgi:Rrf2 family transcriptional regulator, iron-sulfur cluster assembly transcription factor